MGNVVSGRSREAGGRAGTCEQVRVFYYYWTSSLCLFHTQTTTERDVEIPELGKDEADTILVVLGTFPSCFLGACIFKFIEVANLAREMENISGNLCLLSPPAVRQSNLLTVVTATM